MPKLPPFHVDQDLCTECGDCIKLLPQAWHVSVSCGVEHFGMNLLLPGSGRWLKWYMKHVAAVRFSTRYVLGGCINAIAYRISTIRPFFGWAKFCEVLTGKEMLPTADLGEIRQ